MPEGFRSGLKKLLAPPVFPGDEDKTTSSIMIHYGILCGIFANLFAIPSMILAGDPWVRIVLVEGTVLGALAAHAVLLRRGNVRASAIVFGVFAWLVLAAVNYTAGGVFAPGYATHLILIVSLGFVFGGSGAFLVAAASTLLGLVFVGLHERGLMPPPQVENSAGRHWFIVSVSFLAAAAVLSVMMRRFRQIIADGRRELLVRREAERQLERHQALLEETVRARTAELADANRALLAENAERGRAEAALRRERDLIGEIMETSPSGILTLDHEGRVTFANAAAGRILGLDRSELTRAGHLAPGWSLSDVPGGRSPQAPAALPRVFAGTQPVRDARLGIRTGDGRQLLVCVNATPVRDGMGGANCMVMTIDDVTERTRAEQELLKTQKLESVGLLAGGIAHDFNNLLAVILGSVSLARGQLPFDTGAAADLELAEQAVLQARELTQQLLTFARGGSPILQVVDLGEILRRVGTFALRGTNVRGEFAIPAGLWSVRADEGQLGQVVHNLARNACQAMPKGGTLSVGAANVDLPEGGRVPLPAGKYVRVRFRDQGVGIRPETLPKIFDPYFTTKEQGSGLGLAVVHSVISRHGGHVGAESSPGSGTTFEFHLPAVLPYATLAAAALAPEQEAPAEAVPGAGRVLVMDDDPHVRRLLERMLGALGFDAELVENGDQAIEAYRKALEEGCGFAAVLLDLTVPGGMGGAEAMRQLRGIDPKIRAVVSSGYSDDPVMAAYAEHGFCGVLPKPFRPTDLSRVLRRALA